MENAFHKALSNIYQNLIYELTFFSWCKTKCPLIIQTWISSISIFFIFCLFTYTSCEHIIHECSKTPPVNSFSMSTTSKNLWCHIFNSSTECMCQVIFKHWFFTKTKICKLYMSCMKRVSQVSCYYLPNLLLSHQADRILHSEWVKHRFRGYVNIIKLKQVLHLTTPIEKQLTVLTICAASIIFYGKNQAQSDTSSAQLNSVNQYLITWTPQLKNGLTLIVIFCFLRTQRHRTETQFNVFAPINQKLR